MNIKRYFFGALALILTVFFISQVDAFATEKQQVLKYDRDKYINRIDQNNGTGYQFFVELWNWLQFGIVQPEPKFIELNRDPRIKAVKAENHINPTIKLLPQYPKLKAVPAQRYPDPTAVPAERFPGPKAVARQ